MELRQSVIVGECSPGLALAAPVRIVRASTAASIAVIAQAITAITPAAQMKLASPLSPALTSLPDPLYVILE